MRNRAQEIMFVRKQIVIIVKIISKITLIIRSEQSKIYREQQKILRAISFAPRNSVLARVIKRRQKWVIFHCRSKIFLSEQKICLSVREISKFTLALQQKKNWLKALVAAEKQLYRKNIWVIILGLALCCLFLGKLCQYFDLISAEAARKQQIESNVAVVELIKKQDLCVAKTLLYVMHSACEFLLLFSIGELAEEYKLISSKMKDSLAFCGLLCLSWWIYCFEGDKNLVNGDAAYSPLPPR